MLLRSLSARLLALTIFFVMLGEVLIFVPSVARFRMTYFEDHVAAAHIATLALIASPTGKLDQALTDELLAEVGAHSVTLHRQSGVVQMLDGTEPAQPDISVVLGNGGGNAPRMVGHSFATLFTVTETFCCVLAALEIVSRAFGLLDGTVLASVRP